MPRRTWPLVVFDESHRLRNPYSQQSMSCRQVADGADFVVYLSATAGQSPHELSYLDALLAQGPDAPAPTLAGFRELMRRLGIGGALRPGVPGSSRPTPPPARPMGPVPGRAGPGIGPSAGRCSTA